MNVKTRTPGAALAGGDAVMVDVTDDLLAPAQAQIRSLGADPCSDRAWRGLFWRACDLLAPRGARLINEHKRTVHEHVCSRTWWQPPGDP